MENLIAARWDSSAITPPSSERQPNHSYPCPPHPANPPGRRSARGQGRKNKTHTRNVPTHKHGVRPGPRSAPLAVILTRCLGLRSPGPTPTAEFLIFLRVHPPTPRPPTPPPCPRQGGSRWECLVKTQRHRARPVVHNTTPGERGREAPAGPRGPHQGRAAPRPP